MQANKNKSDSVTLSTTFRSEGTGLAVELGRSDVHLCQTSFNWVISLENTMDQANADHGYKFYNYSVIHTWDTALQETQLQVILPSMPNEDNQSIGSYFHCILFCYSI